MRTERRGCVGGQGLLALVDGVDVLVPGGLGGSGQDRPQLCKDTRVCDCVCLCQTTRTVSTRVNTGHRFCLNPETERRRVSEFYLGSRLRPCRGQRRISARHAKGSGFNSTLSSVTDPQELPPPPHTHTHTQLITGYFLKNCWNYFCCCFHRVTLRLCTCCVPSLSLLRYK